MESIEAGMFFLLEKLENFSLPYIAEHEGGILEVIVATSEGQRFIALSWVNWLKFEHLPNKKTRILFRLKRESKHE